MHSYVSLCFFIKSLKFSLLVQQFPFLCDYFLFFILHILLFLYFCLKQKKMLPIFRSPCALCCVACTSFEGLIHTMQAAIHKLVSFIFFTWHCKMRQVCLFHLLLVLCAQVKRSLLEIISALLAHFKACHLCNNRVSVTLCFCTRKTLF